MRPLFWLAVSLSLLLLKAVASNERHDPDQPQDMQRGQDHDRVGRREVDALEHLEGGSAHCVDAAEGQRGSQE